MSRYLILLGRDRTDEEGKDQAAPPQGPAERSALRTVRGCLEYIPGIDPGLGADADDSNYRGGHMAAGMVEEVRTMIKADLVTGMTVQTRDGDWYLAYDGKLVDVYGYLDLVDYTDDLRNIDNHTEFDIMKVCAPSNMAWTIDDILDNHGEVLWERT